MIGRSGSTLWLLGNEMRLAWRNFTSGKRGGRRLIVFAIMGVAFLIPGFLLAWAIRSVDLPINPLTILIGDAVATTIFTLMLSQTLAAATEALYTRGDLDLLFSSPLDPRKILTVRFLSLAASAFMAFAALISPVLLPVALLGHWRWLAILPVLFALALAASASGLALAVGLFALIGPRRTRTVAQVTAALIGAAVFLVGQSSNILGVKSTVWGRIAAVASDPHVHLPVIAAWPLRASIGDPIPLLAMLVAGAALFVLISTWLSRRFAANATAAQGADTKRGQARPDANRVFAGGAFAATFAKELRLLRRDWALLGQVLLRVVYMVPAAFVLLRNATNHADLLLPGGAAALSFLAGQVAGSLTWITVSAEDEPDLLACAPAPTRIVRRAKLAAGLSPLVLLLVGPMLALIVVSPAVGLAATAGVAASAWASALINVWHQRPGKRSEFRSRRSGMWLVGTAQLLVTLLIGAATALAAALLVWALIPAVLAGGMLLLMRRSDAQIARALAEAA